MSSRELYKNHNHLFKANSVFGTISVDYLVASAEEPKGWCYYYDDECIHFCNPKFKRGYFPLTTQPSLAHLKETLHAIADAVEEQ